MLRNVSATGCDLRGYPGIALASTKGAGRPFSYRRRGDQMLTSRPPRLVPVPPGAAAYTAINKITCAAAEVTPVTGIAIRIQVTPPGDDRPLTLTLPCYPILGYCGSGDPGDVIDIAPVTPTVAALPARH